MNYIAGCILHNLYPANYEDKVLSTGLDEYDTVD